MEKIRPHLRKVQYFALGFMLMAFIIESWPEVKKGIMDGYYIR